MKSITNRQINKVFGDYDPGMPKRAYIVQRIAAIFAGYGCGEPDAGFFRELKLINGRRKLTVLGRRFLAEVVVGKIKAKLPSTRQTS